VRNDHRASRGHRNIKCCFAVARREVLIEVLRPPRARGSQRTSNGRGTIRFSFLFRTLGSSGKSLARSQEVCVRSPFKRSPMRLRRNLGLSLPRWPAPSQRAVTVA
jgi:hypothetical protein